MVLGVFLLELSYGAYLCRQRVFAIHVKPGPGQNRACHLLHFDLRHLRYRDLFGLGNWQCLQTFWFCDDFALPVQQFIALKMPVSQAHEGPYVLRVQVL